MHIQDENILMNDDDEPGFVPDQQAEPDFQQTAKINYEHLQVAKKPLIMSSYLKSAAKGQKIII